MRVRRNLLKEILHINAFIPAGRIFANVWVYSVPESQLIRALAADQDRDCRACNEHFDAVNSQIRQPLVEHFVCHAGCAPRLSLSHEPFPMSQVCRGVDYAIAHNAQEAKLPTV